MMRWMLLFIAWVIAACSDASLEVVEDAEVVVPDNKLQVTGEVCTLNPEELNFPLRVLFLVDCSESMEVTDPPDLLTGETGRERAVRMAAEELLSTAGDVKVSVVRFSSESQPLTAELSSGGLPESYFTNDLDYILAKLPLLAETDRTTNFIRALSEAYAEIRHELMKTSQESLALSTYSVIMITDGLPDVEGDETAENSHENIIEGVQGLMELGRLFHVGKLTVNTALLSSGSPLVDIAASDLLSTMANQGSGTFRSFENGGELNFLYVDLTTLKRVFTLKTLVVQNLNAAVSQDFVLSDSDGDGLSDAIEAFIGSNPFVPDSDGDGCRDSVEYNLRNAGLDPIDPDDCQCFVADYCFDEDLDGLCDCGEDPPGSCCQDLDSDGLCDCIDQDANGFCDPSNYVDLDGDGLVNCEERYSGTNRSGPDSDGDGLLDFLELRFGTSPDLNDLADDLDWDAVPNGEEVRTATDPQFASTIGRSDLAYRYKVEETGTVGTSTCYNFEVSNITLTDLLPAANHQATTGPGGQGFSGLNRVLIYAGEVPFDDHESYARFRVACVTASYESAGNYKNPPSGLVQIGNAHFVPIATFDPMRDCIPPGGQ
ncbi:MAG: VWA domain-containing protein [Myxococcota bacterium]|nr:VWA domain-containing protein [Myxococcota bacterium]